MVFTTYPDYLGVHKSPGAKEEFWGCVDKVPYGTKSIDFLDKNLVHDVKIRLIEHVYQL